MLKRQRQVRTKTEDDMEIDAKCENSKLEDADWLLNDEEDLIAKTVSDFRLQRLSMVQTLKQFVLCYESVLEWLVDEMAERDKAGWNWVGG